MPTLVIVDDHEVFRLGLKSKLEIVDDFTIVGEAVNGLQGVECACRLQPDIVLMDIAMPDFNGIEATQRIKSELPATRVLMLTANEDADGVFAALAAGADGYVVKGANIGRIELAIRTVAAGAAWLDPAIAERVIKEARPSPTEPRKRTTDKQELTAREQDVLDRIARGYSNPQIAAEFCLSVETVKTHVRHVMKKLSISNRTQAAVMALRQAQSRTSSD